MRKSAQQKAEDARRLEMAELAYTQARDRRLAERTPEAWDAEKAAWDRREAVFLEVNGPRKRGGYVCRAGQRQAKERELENQLRMKRRRFR